MPRKTRALCFAFAIVSALVTTGCSTGLEVGELKLTNDLPAGWEKVVSEENLAECVTTDVSTSIFHNYAYQAADIPCLKAKFITSLANWKHADGRPNIRAQATVLMYYKLSDEKMKTILDQILNDYGRTHKQLLEEFIKNNQGPLSCEVSNGKMTCTDVRPGTENDDTPEVTVNGERQAPTGPAGLGALNPTL